MNKKICIATGICIVAAALIVAGLAIWHPWSAQISQSSTNGGLSADGIQGSESASSDSPDAGDDSDGRLSWEEYDGTEEEYMDAVASKMSQQPVLTDYDWVYADDGSQYRDQLVAIFFKEGVTKERAQEIVGGVGGDWLYDTFWIDFPEGHPEVEVEYPKGTDILSIVEDFGEYSEVLGATAHYHADAVADAVPNDPYRECQYYLGTDNFTNAWNTIQANGSATIAVLDTGIDMDHPDLKGNIDFASAFDAWKNTRIPIPLEGSGIDPGYEDVDHGTMVAGVACACTDNGIGISGSAYNARVLPVRITDDNIRINDNGSYLSQGFEWEYFNNALIWLQALPAKPQVVNMSFAFRSFDARYTDEIQTRIDDLCSNHKVVFVASVGNHDSSTEVWPARYDNVIGVGAVSESGDSRWVNAGGNGSAYNSSVDICAPGENILTTYNLAFPVVLDSGSIENGYREADGTSLAAPQVAASAALLRVQHPEWSAIQVEKRLESTAKDLGAAGRDDEYGYGLLDVAAAVGYVESPGKEDPSSQGKGFPPSKIPDGAQRTADVLSGAATRDAMPALEILGISGVEESGQFVDLSKDAAGNYTNIYNWEQPKYALIASLYNEKPSPYLANLAINKENGTAQKAVVDEGRDGGGAGPNAALAPYGVSETDDAVWNLKPAVVVGAGDLAGDAEDPTSYYDGLTPGGYTAFGVKYSFSSYSEMCDTMRDIAAAADQATEETGNPGRYAKWEDNAPTDIANNYRTYVEGTIGAVKSAIEDPKNPLTMRTVALVTGTSVVNNQVTFTLGKAGPDGTASNNRYLEATSGSGIAVNYGETHATATISDLTTDVDLILVGGQQSSSSFTDIVDALDAAKLLGKTYFTNNNNATAGAMYGVVMNSVENAQNLGRILGLLYSEVIDQQSWLAYYYETFYHINTTSGYLAQAMTNALNGQVRNSTPSQPSGGTTEQHVQALTKWNVTDPYNGMSKEDVQKILDEGQKCA